MANPPTSALESLDRLVGSWTTEATHPALPGVVVHGTAEVEWLEGKRFIIFRARTDHPDFPDSISILGFTEEDRIDPKTPAEPSSSALSMHYYDSRGVFRDYTTRIDDKAWQWERIAPGFSQRFIGTFADNFRTIDGLSKLRRDDAEWADDLRITYRRRE
jgi:hypothetical protein